MKMIFNEDMFYQDKSKPLYLKGIVYEVPEELGFAQRWLKRGGIEVHEEVKESILETVVEIVEPVETAVNDNALDALSSEEPEAEEEVAKPQPKVENKKGKNNKKA